MGKATTCPTHSQSLSEKFWWPNNQTEKFSLVAFYLVWNWIFQNDGPECQTQVGVVAPNALIVRKTFIFVILSMFRRVIFDQVFARLMIS